MNRNALIYLILLVAVGSLGACRKAAVTSPAPVVPSSPPTPITSLGTPGKPLSATAAPNSRCHLGVGLRQETVDLLLAYRDYPALVMSPTNELARQVFPHLEGWIRVLGAPSIEALKLRAERAESDGLSYEALGYGLETGQSTPEEQWNDLVGSTKAAREIADQYGKLLLMAPGFQLMSKNEELYPSMSALADIWVLQTQKLQVYPPEGKYQQEVQRYVQLIRSGNPNIAIWAQITIPPDREPDVGYWLPYHDAIVNLVDGTYLGVYAWKTIEADTLIKTMATIYARVCSGE